MWSSVVCNFEWISCRWPSQTLGVWMHHSYFWWSHLSCLMWYRFVKVPWAILDHVVVILVSNRVGHLISNLSISFHHLVQDIGVVWSSSSPCHRSKIRPLIIVAVFWSLAILVWLGKELVGSHVGDHVILRHLLRPVHLLLLNLLDQLNDWLADGIWLLQLLLLLLSRLFLLDLPYIYIVGECWGVEQGLRFVFGVVGDS